MSRDKGIIGFIRKIIRFFKDDRFRIIFGTFLVLLAAYLMIAFVSYFFTWKEDQDFVWAQVFSGANVQVENHAGKIGAWVSALFMNHWFGLASFSLPFFFLILGTNLLGLKLFKTWKSIRTLVIATILFSVALGFIFGNNIEFLGSGPGGAHGYFISQWLIAALGKAGTAFLLIILFLGFFLYSFRKTDRVKIKPLKKKRNESGQEENISPAGQQDQMEDNNTGTVAEIDTEKDQEEDKNELKSPDFSVSDKKEPTVNNTAGKEGEEENR